MYQCTICGSQLAQHMCGGTATLQGTIKSRECDHNAGFLDGDCIVCMKAKLDAANLQIAEKDKAMALLVERLRGLLPHRDGTMPCDGPGCIFCDEDEAVVEKPKCEHGDFSYGEWDMKCGKCGERISRNTRMVVGGKPSETILKGLWQLLRAYAGGGMPPMITQGIRLACKNAGMAEDHIVSAELGGGDPDFVKRETEKRIDEVCDSCGWNNGPDYGGGCRVMYKVGKVTTCETCMPKTR